MVTIGSTAFHAETSRPRCLASAIASFMLSAPPVLLPSHEIVKPSEPGTRPGRLAGGVALSSLETAVSIDLSWLGESLPWPRIMMKCAMPPSVVIV